MTDAEILREARDHMALVQTMEHDIREERKKCARFMALKQWKQEDLTSRGSRPSLTVDQTGQFVDQVVNDWRRNRLGIKISPGDANGDDKMAALIEADVRQCEYMSKAQIAYDWAMWCMTALNAGFVQVYTKRRPGTFKKDFWISQIENPDSVYMDQFCMEPDYSDQRICLKTDRYSVKHYQDCFGKTAVLSNFETYSEDQSQADWVTKEAITVGEFWRVVEKNRKIMQLSKNVRLIRGGRGVETDTVYDNEWDFERKGGEVTGIGDFKGVHVLRNNDGDLMEDDEPVRQVWQYLINGVEVLNKTRWEGCIIPIIPMLGKKMYLEGKKLLFSMISRGLDSQQLLNYAVSSMAERLGQFPKNAATVLTGSIKTDAQQWAERNKKLFSFLQVDPVQLPDGTWQSNVQALVNQTDADPRIDQFITVTGLLTQLLKGNLGMYGENVGDHGGKVRSGAAEKALQSEGDNGTFNFLDEGGRGIELVGKVIVDAWPNVRKDPDTIATRDLKGKVKHVRINELRVNMKKVPHGQDADYVVSDAQYHVAVSADPSNDTKRQEDAGIAMQIYQEMPPEQKTNQVTAEVFRLQGSDVGNKIADILDPPQAAQQLPPQVQKAMQVSQKMIESLTQEVHALNDERDAKITENEYKWRVECLKAYVAVTTARISASKDADIADADRTASFLEQGFEHAHDVGIAAMQHAQTLQQNEQQGQLALTQQASQQQADAAQQQAATANQE